MSPDHLGVSRTARYFSLGCQPGATHELWVVLHGYAQLAERFLRWFDPLADGATRVVAPEALSRFYLETGLDGRHGPVIGASWLTREDRDTDLADHVHYLDALIQRLLVAVPSRPRLTVLGFSQGSVMAARWLVRTRCVPDQVILWGTPLPRDLAGDALAGCRRGKPLLFVAGDADPFAPPGAIEGDAAMLQGHGVAAIAQRFTGGHAISGEPLLRAAGRTPPPSTA